MSKFLKEGVRVENPITRISKDKSSGDMNPGFDMFFTIIVIPIESLFLQFLSLMYPDRPPASRMI